MLLRQSLSPPGRDAAEGSRERSTVAELFCDQQLATLPLDLLMRFLGLEGAVCIERLDGRKLPVSIRPQTTRARSGRLADRLGGAGHATAPNGDSCGHRTHPEQPELAGATTSTI